MFRFSGFNLCHLNVLIACLVFVSDLGVRFLSVVTVYLFLRDSISLGCICLRVVSVS